MDIIIVCGIDIFYMVCMLRRKGPWRRMWSYLVQEHKALEGSVFRPMSIGTMWHTVGGQALGLRALPIAIISLL